MAGRWHFCDRDVIASGRPEAPLLVVSDSPPAEGLADGRPLASGSWKTFWRHAESFVLDRDDVRAIYLSCVPHQRAGSCSYAFEEALAASRPKVILCLGRKALEAVYGGDRPIETYRGYLLDPRSCQRTGRVAGWDWSETYRSGPKKGQPKPRRVYLPRAPLPETTQWVVGTVAPGSLFRNLFQNVPWFKADLGRAIRATRAELDVVSLRSSTDPREPEGAVAIDLEGSRDRGEIYDVSLASDTGAWSAPWSEARAIVHQAMQSTQVKIVHNALFDGPLLARNNIPMHYPIFDTMLAFRLLHPDLYCGLERCATVYLDIVPWKWMKDFHPSWYNAIDAIACHRLYPPLKDELIETGQYDYFRNILMPSLSALVGIHHRGIPIRGGGRMYPEYQPLGMNRGRDSGDMDLSWGLEKPLDQDFIYPDRNHSLIEIGWQLPDLSGADRPVAYESESYIRLKQVHAKGYVRNIWGRMKRFYWPFRQEKDPVRFFLHSTVSDTILAMLLPLSRAVEPLGGGICGLSGNGILLEVPREARKSAVDAVNQKMLDNHAICILGRVVIPRVRSGDDSSWKELKLDD